MLKTLVAATILSATLLGASVLPASAHLGASDCAYARQNLADGVGSTNSGSYNANAVAVQNCRAQGIN